MSVDDEHVEEPPRLETFDDVVVETAPRLYRFAARLLGSQAEADDVPQETYLRAFDAWRTGSFAGRSSVLTWLYRITTHVASNAARTRRRATAREQALPQFGVDAARALEANVELLELSKWLDLLPEEQRSVLVLKELEGMTCPEIAAVLCTTGAVEQRLFRARMTLKQRCERG